VYLSFSPHLNFGGYVQEQLLEKRLEIFLFSFEKLHAYYLGFGVFDSDVDSAALGVEEGNYCL